VSGLFWWTGAVVWLLIAAALLWFAAEVLWGLVCSISYNAWIIRTARKSGKLGELKWRRFPLALLVEWWGHIGYRNNGNTVVTQTSTGSQWRGVGDWTVYGNDDPDPPA
jgi:hypothetical protein